MKMRFAICIAAAWLGSGACDPVQGDAVAALGGEVSGTRPGPTHRPGQPCLLCHDGALGDPQEFSIAGTVFQNRADKLAARGAQVEITAEDGAKKTFTTNAAGNFYVTPAQWQPKFPLQVEVHFQGETAAMLSRIGREGSCAGCHSDPPSAASPGHVSAEPEDAGVAP
jgi:hypothetical protein